MSVWNPQLYMKFSSARLRPALDLLNRALLQCQPESVSSVLDLGCGPGNITPYLAKAFPAARVYGVDSSPEMIAQATATLSKSEDRDRVKFSVNSVESCLQPSFLNGQKFDVVYSNACLHWLTGHETLFHALCHRLLTPKSGVFAIQMPDTRHQPSHTLMVDAARNTGFADRLSSVRIPRAEGGHEYYMKILSNDMTAADIWTTEYLHPLPIAPEQRHPVLNLVKSTGLMPYIDALNGENSPECKRFLEEYERLLHISYPATKLSSFDEEIAMLTYRRLFIVATKS